MSIGNFQESDPGKIATTMWDILSIIGDVNRFSSALPALECRNVQID
jgi:hypothetical protein